MQASLPVYVDSGAEACAALLKEAGLSGFMSVWCPCQKKQLHGTMSHSALRLSALPESSLRGTSLYSDTKHASWLMPFAFWILQAVDDTCMHMHIGSILTGNIYPHCNLAVHSHAQMQHNLDGAAAAPWCDHVSSLITCLSEGEKHVQSKTMSHSTDVEMCPQWAELSWLP